MLNLYRLFMRIAGNYAPQFRLTLLYTVLAAIMQSLAFLTLLPILSALYQQAAFSTLFPWLCVLVLLVILQIIFKLNEWRFTHLYWNKLIEEKRLALGDALYTMPLLTLKKYASGDLVEAIGSNVNAMVSALSQIGTLFIHSVVVPLALLFCCLLISWQLGLLLLLACAIMYPLFRLSKARQKSGFSQTTQADSLSAARIIEYIQGLIVFKASGQIGQQAKRLQQAFLLQQSSQHDAHDATKKFIFGGQAVLQITLIIVLLAGALMVYYGAINIASLAVVMILTLYLSEPLGLLAVVNALFEMAEASQHRVEALLAQRGTPSEVSAPPLSRFDIDFDHLSFSYQHNPVLQDIHFTIRQNTITGLVGPSGSGKSTLIQLIAGFIQPDSGSVSIGGQNIAQLASKNLLQHISIVHQEVWLFNDTIKNNILMGNPQASDQQLYQAAQSANIHEFILSLPQQYDTPAGDIGAYLSGGEKQRISIARAILKNAPLVILDEPTSSLDSESEYQVQRALEALVKDKTVIVVAHRLSTVKGADTIIVLENGQIVQQGNHHTLISENGLYQRLWQAQQADS